MDTFIKNMIQDMYDSQGAMEVYVMEITRFSATISVANLQMLDAFARHFSRTRTDLVEEVLNNAVMAMFISLNQSEKSAFAKDCDKQFEEHMKKSCEQNGGSYSRAGLGYWTAYAEAFAEREQKDADANG